LPGGGGVLQSRCQKRELTQSRCEDGRTGIPVEVLKHGHLFFLARPLVSRLSLSRARALCALSLCPLTPQHTISFPYYLVTPTSFASCIDNTSLVDPFVVFFFFLFFGSDLTPPPFHQFRTGWWDLSLCASPAPNPNWIVVADSEKLARSLSLLACPQVSVLEESVASFASALISVS
jgi:hypothetical protein